MNLCLNLKFQNLNLKCTYHLSHMRNISETNNRTSPSKNGVNPRAKDVPWSKLCYKISNINLKVFRSDIDWNFWKFSDRSRYSWPDGPDQDHKNNYLGPNLAQKILKDRTGTKKMKKSPFTILYLVAQESKPMLDKMTK